MRCAVTFAMLLGLGSVAQAAEPIKLEVSDFKLTSDFKGGDELLKNDDDKISFYANGTATAKLTVPADGEYTIVVAASCTAAEKTNAKFTLKVGETVVKENFELTGEDEKEYKFEVKLKKGASDISIKFTNDVYKENEFDRNLYVHSVKVMEKK